MSAEMFSRNALSCANVALAVVFGAGALSKLRDPRPAFETAQRVTSAPALALAIVAAAVVVELVYCASMAVSLVRGRAAALWGTVVLASYSAWLLIVRASIGPDAACGCLSLMGRASVNAALLGNAILVTQVVLVVGFDVCVAGRRAAIVGRTSA